MDKRTFIKSVVLSVAGMFTLGFGSGLKAAKSGRKWDGIFKLPELPYSFDSLDPFIDAETMRVHYLEHHGSFVSNLNKLVDRGGLRGKTAMDLLRNASGHSEAIVRNAGGFLNHKLFWRILTPVKGSRPSDELNKAIISNFGSFDNFREAFGKSAEDLFGSGWIWLIADSQGNLKITTTSNQDSPLMNNAETKGFPVLCLDLWEHAYYSRNKNSRKDYVESFWEYVDWKIVSQRYKFTRSARI